MVQHKIIHYYEVFKVKVFWWQIIGQYLILQRKIGLENKVDDLIKKIKIFLILLDLKLK